MRMLAVDAVMTLTSAMAAAMASAMAAEMAAAIVAAMAAAIVAATAAATATAMTAATTAATVAAMMLEMTVLALGLVAAALAQLSSYDCTWAAECQHPRCCLSVALPLAQERSAHTLDQRDSC